MAFISSYAQLNKKYDLNFSDNNYGFTWDIFKDFVGEQWADFFTANCFYRFVPTARLTIKTWNCLAFDLFVCCNFNDSSVQEVRRYENTHNKTIIGYLMHVCQYLADINMIFTYPQIIHMVLSEKSLRMVVVLSFIIISKLTLLVMQMVIKFLGKQLVDQVIYVQEQMKLLWQKKKKL